MKKELFVAVVLIVCVGLTVYLPSLLPEGRLESAVVNETSEALTERNQRYADEVRQAILQYERVSTSQETALHPENLAQVMTGEALDEAIALRNKVRANRSSPEDGSFERLDLKVPGVYIWEYSTHRIKTLACIREKLAGSIAGTSDDAHRRVMLYVFDKVNGTWKASAVLVIWHWEAEVRDWQDAPQWEKEIVGELPVGQYPKCD